MGWGYDPMLRQEQIQYHFAQGQVEVLSSVMRYYYPVIAINFLMQRPVVRKLNPYAAGG